MHWRYAPERFTYTGLHAFCESVQHYLPYVQKDVTIWRKNSHPINACPSNPGSFFYFPHGWDFVLLLGLKNGWNLSQNCKFSAKVRQPKISILSWSFFCFAFVENDMQVISECVFISPLHQASPFTFMQATNWKQRGRTHKNGGKGFHTLLNFMAPVWFPQNFP